MTARERQREGGRGEREGEKERRDRGIQSGEGDGGRKGKIGQTQKRYMHTYRMNQREGETHTKRDKER